MTPLLVEYAAPPGSGMDLKQTSVSPTISTIRGPLREGISEFPFALVLEIE